MQIPRIEDFMWRQLKRETRTYDFIQQKALEGYNSILSLLVKALDLFKSKSQQDKAIEYGIDAYKVIDLTVKAISNARVEKIKRELHIDYRSIGKSENTSATCLSGEIVNEKIKKLQRKIQRLSNRHTRISLFGRHQDLPEIQGSLPMMHTIDCRPDGHTLPPLGNFADIPYLKEQSFLHRIRYVCTL